MSIQIDHIIILIGIFSTLFYAFQAVEIFQRNERDRKYLNYNLSWWIHQRWINFVGSAVGWLFIYLLSLEVLNSNLHLLIVDMSLGHVFLFVFGLLGIMGFLPITLWGLAQSFQFMADLIRKK